MIANSTQDGDAFRVILRKQLKRTRRLAGNPLLRTEEGWRFVANNDWESFLNPPHPLPELAVVADNPGQDELEVNVYLCGSRKAKKVLGAKRTAKSVWTAGDWARYFFDFIFGADAVESGWVIFLNKSSFHTPSTENLTDLLDPCHSITDECLRTAIRDDQKANGCAVAEIARTLAIPILTIGVEDEGKKEGGKKTFDCYIESLRKNLKKYVLAVNTSMTCAFHLAPHFSYGNFFKHCENIPGWDDRLDGFLKDNPAVRTKPKSTKSTNIRKSTKGTKGNNASWTAIQKEKDGKKLAKRYLNEVILGGRDPNV